MQPIGLTCFFKNIVAVDKQWLFFFSVGLGPEMAIEPFPLSSPGLLPPVPQVGEGDGLAVRLVVL